MPDPYLDKELDLDLDLIIQTQNPAKIDFFAIFTE